MRLDRRAFLGTTGLAAASVVTRQARAATPRDALVIVREISSIADWDPAVSQILDTNEINGDLYDRLVGYDPRDPRASVPYFRNGVRSLSSSTYSAMWAPSRAR